MHYLIVAPASHLHQWSAHLHPQGFTQYEVFRWRDLYAVKLQEAKQQLQDERQQQEGRQEGEELGGSKGPVGMADRAGSKGGTKKTVPHNNGGNKKAEQQKAADRVRMPGNINNRGAWQNLLHVLFPEHALRQALGKSPNSLSRGRRQSLAGALRPGQALEGTSSRNEGDRGRTKSS